MSGHCEGVCTSGTMGCALIRGSPRDIKWGPWVQKSLMFMRFHEVFLGNQHEIWSKRHNGKVRQIPRLESFLMPANFSSLVGEFMNIGIPKYCQTVIKNRYHNGHPDLLPKGLYPGDSVLHATEGIEVKGSRNRRGWQGHNPEAVWLMVFVFDANSARDELTGLPPKPFRFVKVVGAKLTLEDWQFSGRSGISRRTITATVKPSGYDKMTANWIYNDPEGV